MSSAVTLGNTIGAALIGAFFAAIMYGVTTILVFLYFTNYPDDWRIQKITVAILWILDSFHLSMTIAAVYHYTITSFGSLEALQLFDWTLKLQITINVVIIVFVQTLYALRVWKLGGGQHHRLWAVVVFVVLAGGYVVGILLALESYRAPTFEDILSMSWAVIAAFVASTFIDIVLSGAMCYYLIKSRSGFATSNNMIYYIIRMTLTSGALTSVCSLVALITYAIMPNNLVFFGIEFLLTKLYISSYLAMLNARRSIREKDSTVGGSGNTNKLVNVRTITTSHVYRDRPVDSSIGTEDDNTSIRMKSLGDKSHDFDPISSWDQSSPVQSYVGTESTKVGGRVGFV